MAQTGAYFSYAIINKVSEADLSEYAWALSRRFVYIRITSLSKSYFKDPCQAQWTAICIYVRGILTTFAASVKGWSVRN